MTEQFPIARSMDPVTFEVIRGGLLSICEEMRSVMCRAAFSPLLSLSADLSTAILDLNGEVIGQGNDIPVHLGAMPFTGRAVIEDFPIEEWRPADAVLTNDPYRGGNHLPDMTLICPIFIENTIVGFAANRVHWPDVGGAAAGSASVTDEIIKEGLRIPPIKLVREGKFDPTAMRLIFSNVRIPRDRLGDLNAQYACNGRGVQRVKELGARYGIKCISDAFEKMKAVSRLQVQNIIASFPQGKFSAEDRLDGDGFSEDRGEGNFLLKVTIEVKDNFVHFDFTGTAGPARGPVNAPYAVTASVCYYVLLALCGGEISPNSGAYSCVRVTAPEGCLLHAMPPSPVVSANTETSNRLVDLLFQAFSKALPEKVIAGSYGSGGIFTLGGWDPIRHRQFVHYESLGGGMGASSNSDGLNGIRVHMGNTMNLPVEAVEAALPIIIEEYSLIADSGGNGVHRGGMGSRKVIRSLAPNIEFSVGGERSLHPAHGLAGGATGRCSKYAVRRANGTTEGLSSKTQAGKLGSGDQLVIETAGGGAWGSITNRKE